MLWIWLAGGVFACGAVYVAACILVGVVLDPLMALAAVGKSLLMVWFVGFHCCTAWCGVFVDCDIGVPYKRIITQHPAMCSCMAIKLSYASFTQSL